jgi:hypothetical protein
MTTRSNQSIENTKSDVLRFLVFASGSGSCLNTSSETSGGAAKFPITYLRIKTFRKTYLQISVLDGMVSLCFFAKFFTFSSHSSSCSFDSSKSSHKHGLPNSVKNIYNICNFCNKRQLKPYRK